MSAQLSRMCCRSRTKRLWFAISQTSGRRSAIARMMRSAIAGCMFRGMGCQPMFIHRSHGLAARATVELVMRCLPSAAPERVPHVRRPAIEEVDRPANVRLKLLGLPRARAVAHAALAALQVDRQRVR